jgi:hypothetical protein
MINEKSLMFNDFFKKELEKRIKETNVTDVKTDNIDDILKGVKKDFGKYEISYKELYNPNNYKYEKYLIGLTKIENKKEFKIKLGTYYQDAGGGRLLYPSQLLEVKIEDWREFILNKILK